MQTRPQLSVPLELLACPVDRTPLTLSDAGDTLVSPAGQRYPVVEGVPVLLRANRPVTVPFMAESLAQAWRHVNGEPPAAPGHGAPLFLTTIGVSDDQRADLLARVGDLPLDEHPVDPVAAFLVAATNGLAYLGSVGSLGRLPLPAPPLPPGRGELVVDVGCSWGRWSLSLATAGYRVIGVDPSLGAVLAARRSAARLGLPASFIVGDARSLPLQAERLDRAFSYSVIQHFSYEDAAAAVGEIGRVLRPGGRALVQMPNILGARSLQHQFRRRFRPARDFQVRYWPLKRLRSLFEARVGPVEIGIDCFFGLGLQASDLDLMSPTARIATRLSEALKGISRAAPWLPLERVADSVYLDATRAGSR